MRLGCEPVAKGIEFRGEAVPSSGFTEALETAGCLVYCPSNPFLSIAPVLSLPGVREGIASFQGPRIAVSPIVGGRALRGPGCQADGGTGLRRVLRGGGIVVSGICDGLVIDRADREEAEAVAATGLRAEIADTVMTTERRQDCLGAGGD